MRKLLLLAVSLFIAFLNVSRVAAQAPVPTTPPVWSGNFGGGLALTNGNSDTKNFNFSFGLVRVLNQKNLIKLNGLYLRGDKEGDAIIDRTTFGLRDEYSFSKRVFAFGQLDHLRDKFKEIIFLWSPTVGVGYKLLDRDVITMTVDNGLGGIWERNPARDTRSSGAYSAAERLNWKLSNTAAITQLLS